MRAKLTAIGIVAVAVGSYLAGYMPEHGLRIAAEAQSAALQEKLTAAEIRLRNAALLGQLLTVKEVAARQDYGQALERSSAFFDAIRVEAAPTPGGAQDHLNAILALRDAVTASLARNDPAVVDHLHGIELRLRRALEYPMPPEPAVP